MNDGETTSEPDGCYRGRFAPSPTGPLHFGSLVAALASYLDARAANGEWLVRIEDLDRQREVRGAADGILRTLDAFGFEWDHAILYQSSRLDAYDEAIEQLNKSGSVFPCACSRREIAKFGASGADGPVYPGICRNGLPAGRQARSLRLRIGAGRVLLHDRIQPPLFQDLEKDVGDFVLRRADGIHAYQLAVVVDDSFQGVNQIVRGADLLPSTPRQICLLRALDCAIPSYSHVPLVVDTRGRKLSKSEAAAPVNPANPVPCLLKAWRFLGQEALPERPSIPHEFWAYAIPFWQTARVPSRISLPLDHVCTQQSHRTFASTRCRTRSFV